MAALGCRGESVAIVAIEKANATINKLAQQKRLGKGPAAISVLRAGFTMPGLAPAAGWRHLQFPLVGAAE